MEKIFISYNHRDKALQGQQIKVFEICIEQNARKRNAFLLDIDKN